MEKSLSALAEEEGGKGQKGPFPAYLAGQGDQRMVVPVCGEADEGLPPLFLDGAVGDLGRVVPGKPVIVLLDEDHDLLQGSPRIGGEVSVQE
jgi:hypothetical protein